MSWLHERFTMPSAKNGLITCVRWFGAWNVWVAGYAQTGAYFTNMFDNAFGRLPREVVVKRVLMLGLGGGG